MINFSFPLEELEYYLLIVVRVTGFIFAAPFFSMNNVPRQLKVTLSLFLAFLIYNVMTPHIYLQYNTIFEYTILILKEAIAGLLIGLGAQFCMLIVNFAGHLVDVEIGFSMAQTFDPATRQQVTVTSNYYQNAIMLMLIITGMYQYLMQALVDTFKLIPVGQVEIIWQSIFDGMLKFLADYIVISFRICLPVFCTILLLNGFLGVMAKVSPQMNMFAVGMQLKVLVGLGVLIITSSMLPGAANFIFDHMKVMIVTFVEALGGA